MGEMYNADKTTWFDFVKIKNEEKSEISSAAAAASGAGSVAAAFSSKDHIYLALYSYVPIHQNVNPPYFL